MAPNYYPPFKKGMGTYVGTTYPTHSAYSVDFNATDGSDFGDPVLASIPATVYEWYAPNGQLKTRDDNGYEAWYVHLSSKNVNVGDKVATGQIIGKIGDSFGRVVTDAEHNDPAVIAAGPHLHFNAAYRGVQIPIAFHGTRYSASVSPNTAYLSGPPVSGELDGPIDGGGDTKLPPIDISGCLPQAAMLAYFLLLAILGMMR